MAKTRMGSYHGRHRLGRPGLMHCRTLMAMAAALNARKAGWRPVRHDQDSVRARVTRMPGAVVPLNVPALIDGSAHQPGLAA
ncbi:MAG: hypothetical protein ACR2KJ_07475 [Jatrophihabitans sp.]